RLAVDAAVEAGREIARAFGSELTVRYKSAEQPVTEVDLAADAMLRERLSGARREYGWLSEETAAEPPASASTRTWVVDPLDGTRNFVEGLPEFAVCVGLLEGTTPILGVVHD